MEDNSHPDKSIWGESSLHQTRGAPGTEVPLDAELAAALAGPRRQFAGMLAWTARKAAPLDHGERETAIAGSGREL